MAEHTAIAWTDATVSFWWGCSEAGPGCDNCYARDMNNWRGNGQWGPGAPRRWIKGAPAMLRKLQRGHGAWMSKYFRHRRVFLHSMSDFFDNEVDRAWRVAACSEIENAPDLDIQIVTKRLTNVEKLAPAHWLAGGWPQHVGLMVTICTQTEWDRDVPRLIALKLKHGIPWIGISMEPMLEEIHIVKPVDIGDLQGVVPMVERGTVYPPIALRLLDWIIVGGESGRFARPLHPRWVRRVQRNCGLYDVAFFFKQWGAWAPGYRDGADITLRLTKDAPKKLRWHKWFDGTPPSAFVGADRSGDKLDGQRWQDFPTFGRTGPRLGVDMSEEAGGGSMEFVNGSRTR
ncbi:DUF5131 family protein [Oricola sp.]|uniref:DUF5131 family protein n=1 Tax=Oricola sp. TaxID=1979950 RepID=UPI003BAD53F9